MKTPARLAAALIVCMLCGVSIASAANSGKSTKTPTVGGSEQRVGSPNVLVFNRALESTSVVYDEPLTTLTASTFSPVDPLLNFTCPFTTCTVTAEMHVQLGGNSTEGNAAALCAQVDGNYMAPPPGGGCPYTSLLRTDTGYSENSFTFVQSGVKKGKHTMQGIVFTIDGATLANYTIVYRLYKP